MYNIRKILTNSLIKASVEVGIASPEIKLEYPEDSSHGDFSCNIALIYAKELKISPMELARKLCEKMTNNEIDFIKSIDIAGPGFINFKIEDSYFINSIVNISKKLENYGKIEKDKGKKIMVEYTDPNPFKVFHIGHLMANAIGESISRIVEFSEAKVVRACYQGDIGLHVAKTIWAILQDEKKMTIEYLSERYVFGNEKYEIDEIAKREIIEVNKKIFEKSDTKINEIYKKGRKLSLEYFDEIYKKLGTKFDDFFFESEVAPEGIKIIKNNDRIFEKSEGATVFSGEKYGLHTRVFINSQGLPTYEAKELGLTKVKFQKHTDLKESIVITANEQNEYFKVVLSALKHIYPHMSEKTKHISHGLLRPASGKMSSRKGNVVAAEDFIKEAEALVEGKIKDKKLTESEKNKIKSDVAIAGIKYTILRQAIGGDIIYNPEKAMSFEGDSGPYLQYSAVRANAVLEKAKNGNSFFSKFLPKKSMKLPLTVTHLEKLLLRFPEIIERSRKEYAPHYIVTYLTELSGAFNSYYSQNQIIDKKDSLSKYKILLTKVFAQVMKNGLWVLGIKVPERM